MRGEVTKEPGPSEQVRNNFPEGLDVAAREISMHHHDQVESVRHLAPVQANVLPQPPLDAIPSDRATEARSDGEPQPLSGAVTTVHEDADASARDLFAAADDFPKLFRGANTVRPRKPMPHLRHRQPLSPLGPPAGQDSPAPHALHPPAKAVGAFSLNAAGLIGALHSSRPSPSNVTLLKRLIVVLCDSLVNFNPRRPGTGQKVVVIVGLACYKNRAKLYPGSCHQARVLVQHPFLRWNPTS